MLFAGPDSCLPDIERLFHLYNRMRNFPRGKRWKQVRRIAVRTLLRLAGIQVSVSWLRR